MNVSVRATVILLHTHVIEWVVGTKSDILFATGTNSYKGTTVCCFMG